MGPGAGLATQAASAGLATWQADDGLGIARRHDSLGMFDDRCTCTMIFHKFVRCSCTGSKRQTICRVLCNSARRSNNPGSPFLRLPTLQAPGTMHVPEDSCLRSKSGKPMYLVTIRHKTISAVSVHENARVIISSKRAHERLFFHYNSVTPPPLLF